MYIQWSFIYAYKDIFSQTTSEYGLIVFQPKGERFDGCYRGIIPIERESNLLFHMVVEDY